MATTLTEVRKIAKRTGECFEAIYQRLTGREFRMPEVRMQPAPFARSRSLSSAAQRRLDAENRAKLARIALRYWPRDQGPPG